MKTESDINGLSDSRRIAVRWHISERSVRTLIASGQLRSIMIGRRRLVSEQALREFIEAREARDGNAETLPSQMEPSSGGRSTRLRAG